MGNRSLSRLKGSLKTLAYLANTLILRRSTPLLGYSGNSLVISLSDMLLHIYFRQNLGQVCVLRCCSNHCSAAL